MCLADYCDILGCEETLEAFNTMVTSSLCSSDAMAQRRIDCIVRTNGRAAVTC